MLARKHPMLGRYAQPMMAKERDGGLTLDDAAPDFSRYPTYDQLTAMLHDWEAAYPHLLSVESLGTSPEGRDLWSATVTDMTVGSSDDKPAIYIDGNIHAGEVLPSVVCLYTIWDLISRFSQDQEVTDLLHTRTFYIRPRVAPDGAERYLTSPDRLRSAARLWPREQPAPGLHAADVDGDGHILQMRILDPAGEWRVSDLDDRLMVRRGLDDEAGTRYRLLPEGTVHGPLNGDLQPAAPRWGLDFNRSFPHNWQPEYRQGGAGPYPLFPPETRATADFFLAHPNIGAAVAYHTFGGFVFHLPSSTPASTYNHDDLPGPYQELTDAFTRVTGRPGFQSYDEATDTARSGSFMDWAYSQRGVYTWVPELWDAADAAGVHRDPEDLVGPLDEAGEAALLRWNDEHLGGQGFMDWQPFDHPQFGPVEIGGWTYKFTHQNCPGSYIPALARPHVDWTYLLARALPQLAIERTTVTNVGGEIWALEVQAVNEGYLPTNGSQQAIDVGLADPVTITVEGAGVEAVDGELSRDLGHLEGYGSKADPPWRGPVPARRSAMARLVLRVPAATDKLRVRVASSKAGAVSRIVDLTTDADDDAGLS